jgi:hypothetical protein
MVTTYNVGTSVRIDWIAPYNRGSTIIAYNVQIKNKLGTFVEELTYCNARTDSTIIGNLYCVIPMDTLKAAPFNLVQGDVIIAKVLA